MFETFEEYAEKKYSPLESEFLEQTKKTLSGNFAAVEGNCLEQWRRAISVAVEVQSFEKIPCAYMSVSFLSNSIFEGKPAFQIDFFDECGLYGVNFSTSRADAEFLFSHWEKFTAAALAENFDAQDKIFRLQVTMLFWATLDKVIFLFADFAQNFVAEIKKSAEFARLVKTEKFYITCGPNADLRNKIGGVLPEVDLTTAKTGEDLSFREWRGKIYRQENFSGLNLSNCRFENCRFEGCSFADLDLSGAVFERCEFGCSEFVGVKMLGANFSECKLERCKFQNSCTETAEKYFAPLKFERCEILNTDCDFAL